MDDRRKAVLIGLFAGALLGAAFAWVASDGSNEGNDGEISGVAKLGPTDYFSLGVSILTLARQFGDMLR